MKGKTYWFNAPDSEERATFFTFKEAEKAAKELLEQHEDLQEVSIYWQEVKKVVKKK